MLRQVKNMIMTALRFLLLLFVMYLMGQFYAASQISKMRACIEQGKSEVACAKEYDWAGKIPQRKD